MPGKFSCRRDEVVYRASLDGLGGNDQIGNVDEYGLHHSFVQDFYGKHYIVTENSVGFVDVEAFDTTFVDSDGALKAIRGCRQPVARTVRRLRRLVHPAQ